MSTTGLVESGAELSVAKRAEQTAFLSDRNDILSGQTRIASTQKIGRIGRNFVNHAMRGMTEYILLIGYGTKDCGRSRKLNAVGAKKRSTPQNLRRSFAQNTVVLKLGMQNRFIYLLENGLLDNQTQS